MTKEEVKQYIKLRDVICDECWKLFNYITDNYPHVLDYYFVGYDDCAVYEDRIIIYYYNTHSSKEDWGTIEVPIEAFENPQEWADNWAKSKAK